MFGSWPGVLPTAVHCLPPAGVDHKASRFKVPPRSLLQCPSGSAILGVGCSSAQPEGGHCCLDLLFLPDAGSSLHMSCAESPAMQSVPCPRQHQEWPWHKFAIPALHVWMQILTCSGSRTHPGFTAAPVAFGATGFLIGKCCLCDGEEEACGDGPEQNGNGQKAELV